MNLSLEKAWSTYLEMTKDRKRSDNPRLLSQYQSWYDKLLTWLRQEHPKTKKLSDLSKRLRKHVTIATEYARYLDGELSQSTYNKHITFLARMWEWCGEQRNPWVIDVSRYRMVDANGHEPLPVDVVHKMIDMTIDTWLKSLLMVGLYTGQRLRDCVYLRWGQINFNTGIIEFDPSKTKKRKRKNKTYVPMIDALRRDLYYWYKKYPISARCPGDYVNLDAVKVYQSTDPNGREISDRVRCLIEKVRLDPYYPKEENRKRACRYSFHSLRHTFCTVARQAGWPQWAIDHATGHTDKSTSDIYQNVSPQMIQNMASAFHVEPKPAQDITPLNKERFGYLSDGKTITAVLPDTDEVRSMLERL